LYYIVSFSQSGLLAVILYGSKHSFIVTGYFSELNFTTLLLSSLFVIIVI